MLKLRTNIPVKYNDGKAEQATGHITGFISRCIQDFDHENFMYIYRYTNDDNQQVDPSKNSFVVNKDTINQMYEMVKNYVDPLLPKYEHDDYVNYIAYRNEMALTFKILPSQIDIIEF